MIFVTEQAKIRRTTTLTTKSSQQYRHMFMYLNFWSSKIGNKSLFKALQNIQIYVKEIIGRIKDKYNILFTTILYK